jgi:hypothetical protein
MLPGSFAQIGGIICYSEYYIIRIKKKVLFSLLPLYYQEQKETGYLWKKTEC